MRLLLGYACCRWPGQEMYAKQSTEYSSKFFGTFFWFRYDFNCLEIGMRYELLVVRSG